MVIISIAIHKARKEYKCSDCERWIEIGQLYFRLYGSAHDYETPYELMIHSDCMRQTGARSKDILKALDRAKVDYIINNGELIIKQ